MEPTQFLIELATWLLLIFLHELELNFRTGQFYIILVIIIITIIKNNNDRESQGLQAVKGYGKVPEEKPATNVIRVKRIQ
jgi:hypothetical protein